MELYYTEQFFTQWWAERIFQNVMNDYFKDYLIALA